MKTQSPVSLTAQQVAESLLNRLFGAQVGLNADWSVCAWRVSGKLYAGIFITDDEDGSFSVVRSTLDSDEMHATESLKTEDAQFVASLVEFATAQKLISP